MQHIQTQEEWEVEMSLKIIEYIKNEIYLDLRFMSAALSVLTPKSDKAVHTFATDGSFLCFSTEQIYLKSKWGMTPAQYGTHPL